MKQKYLIAAGDSMTADLISHKQIQLGHIAAPLGKPFPVWSRLLSSKLNMKEINLGLPGGGNQAIFEKTTFEVSKYESKDIGLVVVMWSEYFRLDIRIPTPFKYLRLKGDSEIFKIMHKKAYLKQMGKIDTYNYLNMLVENNLRWIHLLQSYLESRNIRYLMISGLNPITNLYHHDKFGAFLHPNYLRYFSEIMINSHFYNLIDKIKYIGFPGYLELNGFSWDNKLACYDPEKNKTRIGKLFNKIGLPFDMHPNGLGHEHGAELINEYYEKIY